MFMQCLGSYCYELPKHLSAPKLVCVYLNFSTFDIFFLPIYKNCFEPCIVKTLLVKTTFGGQNHIWRGVTVYVNVASSAWRTKS